MPPEQLLPENGSPVVSTTEATPALETEWLEIVTHYQQLGKPEISQWYTPIYWVTGFFGTIIVLGCIATPFRGQHHGLIRSTIMLTSFCLWLFWLTVYVSQMNPVMAPKLSNTSLAWISYTWGDLAQPQSTDTTTITPATTTSTTATTTMTTTTTTTTTTPTTTTTSKPNKKCYVWWWLAPKCMPS